jgi:hypothetical protein
MTRAREIATQGGLVLLNTTSFTAQASVSFNNVFTSTYDNYKIIFHATANIATGTLQLRLRSSGTDTSANYRSERVIGIDTTLQAYPNVSGTDDFHIGNVHINGSGTTVINLDVYSPAVARTTLVEGSGGLSEGANPNQQQLNVYGLQTDAPAFDGFTILPSAGTITGTVKVYGYK